MKLFAQIRKVDEEKRLVYGRAVQEVADRVDEVFDYATSKPYFQEWSKSFSDATDGKSKGNIRAMHGKISAGIVKEIDFADAEKAIDIAAHINDDQEWKKVLDGNYTGFSIGGSYVGNPIAEKMDGKDVKRYTANPSEISIVDSPCIPSAKFFQVVKADGAVIEKAFATPPLEVHGTDEQVQAFAKALNDNGLTMADAITLIEKAAHEKANPPQADPNAELIAAIGEAMKAGALQTKLLDKATSISDIVKIADEYQETVTPETLADMPGLAKRIVDKAMTAANRDRLQAAHDHLVGIGAACGDSDKDGKATKPEMTKATADTLQQKLADALTRLEKLEKLPVPHVMLRTVSKGYEKPNDPAQITTPVEKGATDEQQEALLAKGYAWLIKGADGVIDWKASAEKLANEQRAAA